MSEKVGSFSRVSCSFLTWFSIDGDTICLEIHSPIIPGKSRSHFVWEIVPMRVLKLK